MPCETGAEGLHQVSGSRSPYTSGGLRPCSRQSLAPEYSTISVSKKTFKTLLQPNNVLESHYAQEHERQGQASLALSSSELFRSHHPYAAPVSSTSETASCTRNTSDAQWLSISSGSSDPSINREHSSVSSGLAFPPKNFQGAFKYQHFTEENTRNKNAASISLNEGNGASLGQEHLLREAVTPSLQVQWIKQTEKLRKQQKLTKPSLVRKIQTKKHHIGFSMQSSRTST